MGFTCNLLSCTDQPLPLNMKLVILFALLAVAAAAPQQAVLRSSEARMNPDVATNSATRSMTAPEWSTVESRNRSLLSTLELYREDSTHSLAKVCNTPLTGLPIRTDSSPKEIICPELFKMLNTLSIFFN